jgi:uncharacterized tellurite resistance protein B-like protein
MLDLDERRAFALLADMIIEADGIVVGREAAALAALKAEMGVAESGIDLRSIEELASVFKDRNSKVAVMLELFGLAYSDTSFDMSELSLIATVAHHMGLPTSEVETLEQWVQDYVALVRRAMAMMRN